MDGVVGPCRELVGVGLRRLPQTGLATDLVVCVLQDRVARVLRGRDLVERGVGGGTGALVGVRSGGGPAEEVVAVRPLGVVRAGGRGLLAVDRVRLLHAGVRGTGRSAAIGEVVRRRPRIGPGLDGPSQCVGDRTGRGAALDGRGGGRVTGVAGGGLLLHSVDEERGSDRSAEAVEDGRRLRRRAAVLGAGVDALRPLVLVPDVGVRLVGQAAGVVAGVRQDPAAVRRRGLRLQRTEQCVGDRVDRLVGRGVRQHAAG